MVQILIEDFAKIFGPDTPDLFVQQVVTKAMVLKRAGIELFVLTNFYSRSVALTLAQQRVDSNNVSQALRRDKALCQVRPVPRDKEVSRLENLANLVTDSHPSPQATTSTTPPWTPCLTLRSPQRTTWPGSLAPRD